MFQLNFGLPPVFAPRMDSFLHRLRHARDADGKMNSCVDREIHDNLLSFPSMEFCPKASAASSPYLSYHFIPHHHGTSLCPPPPQKPGSAPNRPANVFCRTVYPYPIRSIRLIRLFFKITTRL